jgi:hypothetical protein
VVSIQMSGDLAPGTALYRSGAQAGDTIYVTGTLGDAAAGLGRTGTTSHDDSRGPRPGFVSVKRWRELRTRRSTCPTDWSRTFPRSSRRAGSARNSTCATCRFRRNCWMRSVVSRCPSRCSRPRSPPR